MSKVREDLCVVPIVLGRLPSGSGKLTDLARIDDHDPQSRRQAPRQRHFESVRRFEHDQGGLKGV